MQRRHPLAPEGVNDAHLLKMGELLLSNCKLFRGQTARVALNRPAMGGYVVKNTMGVGQSFERGIRDLWETIKEKHERIITYHRQGDG